MAQNIRWPRPGDRLVHRFRRRESEAVAEVLSVDKKNNRIAVRVDDHVYDTLSAAAKSITGYPINGWVYWGLKSQHPRQDKRLSKG